MSSRISRSPSAIALLSLSVLLLGGCNDEKVAKLEERVTALENQVKDLGTSLKAVQEKQTAETAKNPNNAAPTPEAAVDKSAQPVQTDGAFSDIAGMFGEKQIKDLVRIGVLDTSSGKFEPTKPLMRAEFVEWLVKSNNALRPDKVVRPAEPGAKSSFPDLSTNHPNFKYVQGMADAGWSIGYTDKTFKPDKELTREEMIGIKALFDEQAGSSNGPEWVLGNTWSDWKKISKSFVDAMGKEAGSQLNWSRIYGTTKNCDPQKVVSRGEGAVCVWQIGRFPVNAGTKKE